MTPLPVAAVKRIGRDPPQSRPGSSSSLLYRGQGDYEGLGCCRTLQTPAARILARNIEQSEAASFAVIQAPGSHQQVKPPHTRVNVVLN